MVSPVQQQLINAQLTPAALRSQISAAIAAKTQQASRQQGAAVLQLLDAANPDATVPPDPTLGNSLDITA